MKPDIEVLDEALALVEGDGRWCKGAYCRQEGLFESFCLEGALAYANGYLFENTAALPELAMQWYRLKHLVLQASGADESLIGSLCAWNDREDTSQEDAILALKVARGNLENS